MKAMKLVETKRDGEYEIKKFHVVDGDIDQDELIEFCDDKLDCYSDYEASFTIGIYLGFDEEIWCIDISKFVEHLRGLINDEDDEEDKKDLESMFKKLEKYREYTLYFDLNILDIGILGANKK